MKKPLLALLLAGVIPSLAGQEAQSLRGGWIADSEDGRHILYLVMRDGRISGTWCVDCRDPDNLALIDDGEPDGQGLRFTLYHYPSDGKAFREQATVRAEKDELHMTVRGEGGDAGTRSWVLRRTPPSRIRSPVMPDFRPNLRAEGGERILPGPPESPAPQAIAGLWLWGTGPAKQHFIFKVHKGNLRGMVCGPCDSAPDTAALEAISLEDGRLHFEIRHEDNGAALAEHGPYSNVVEAVIAENEMHLRAVPSYADEGTAAIEMTLLGPIRHGTR